MTANDNSHEELLEQIAEGTPIGAILCGERMTRGYTAEDVANKLHLRKHIIDGLEANDLSVFDRPEFAPGNIRTYARFLGLQVDLVLQAYRDQAGLIIAQDGVSKPKKNKQSKSLNEPRYTPGEAQIGFFDYALGFFALLISSLPAMLVLVVLGGVAWGGLQLLNGFQKFEIAPVENRPVALTPLESDALRPQEELTPENPIPNINYEDLYARQALETPVVTPRVGRIADVDPEATGALASEPQVIEPVAVVTSSGEEGNNIAEPTVSLGPQLAKLELVPFGEAWVQVKNQERETIFEKLMSPGDSNEIQMKGQIPVLRAGNASELYVRIDGKVYGPVGKNGTHVVRNVLLLPESVATEYQEVTPDKLERILERERLYREKNPLPVLDETTSLAESEVPATASDQ